MTVMKGFSSYILFFFLLSGYFISNFSIAQPVQQEWVRRYNDTSTALWQALSIKSDGSGFIYVLAGAGNNFGFLKYNSSGNLITAVTHWPVGYDYGSAGYIEVTPDGNVYTTGIVGINFNYWIYTVKFSSSGAFQWGRFYNYDNIDGVNDLALDNAGNIIIVGGATIGSTTYALTVKYNSAGDTLWTRKFNQPPNYPAVNNNLVLDGLNNIYVTGYIVRPGVPGKCLILKYDSNGNLNWFNSFTIDSTYSNSGHGISLDASGNTYITGTQLLPPFGNIYTYLLKVARGGTILWSRLYQVPIGNGDALKGPVVSRSSDAIYYSIGGANGLGGGGYSIFTLKYTPAGDTQWVRVFGGGGVFGTANVPGAIKLDKYDNIYVCGVGNYPTTGDDFATIKYSPSGVQQWVMTYTGIITNGGEGANDLYIDTNLNVYVTGSSPNSLGGRAAVVIKYSQFVGVEPGKNVLPSAFKLYQNYPNPFNLETIIDYEIPITNFVKLIVFDILGRQTATLVNEKQHSGSYEVRFDGSNYCSGLYFYKLISDGNTIDTKKIVLLK